VKLILLFLALLLCAGCSGNNDNAHTTATTAVPPPPRQVLRAEMRPSQRIPAKVDSQSGNFDPTKPLLLLYYPGDETFAVDDEVLIVFALANAKLRGEGGEYRVRYIVDDDDMQWLDRWYDVALTGWLPGKHTLRVELVGPDGWPVRNGDFNIETQEILIGSEQ
jgi:hypothetical protein